MASRIIDNLLAYRILIMLVTPFDQTEAYKLGIIDEHGKNLIKSSNFNNSEQKSAYTFLHRLVFNIKKIINKLPGGENKLKSLITALWLIKEQYKSGDRSMSTLEERFMEVYDLDVVLAEETVIVEGFLDRKMKSLEDPRLGEDGGGGAGGAGGGAPAGGIANVTGAGVSTDIPVPKKKDIDKYKKTNVANVLALTRRNNKVM